MTAAATTIRGRVALRALAAGFLETGSVVAGVLAFGLLWAGAGARLAGATAYPPAGPQAESGERDVRWLVDGFNVLHAGVLRGNDRQGWWREEMRARLLERVAGFDDEAAELWVVFDGRGPLADAELRSARPRVVFAPSADDWLLAEVRGAEDPAQIVVVTADRQLADRARHRGARVVSPRAFLARCGVGS
jgi:predicted RNA-binding protein with PIN domain